MASARALARIERLAWTFIYAGLFALVLGIAVRGADAAAGWALIAGGAIVTLAGAVLVVVRSRLRLTD